MNFERYELMLPGYRTWDDAVEACYSLGDRWRLPTMEELKIMHKNYEFGNYGLWSCEEEDGFVWSMGLHTGNVYLNPKSNINYVWPVRTIDVGKEYWGSDIPYPLSPSDEDVKEFMLSKVHGTTLLLGCTKKLIPISDYQMDIDPWYDGPNVIKQDWLTNKTFYSNIIGDGLFAFSKELTDGIIMMASKYSKRLIMRVFNKKLPTMKTGLAVYFPKKEDFIIEPDYSINRGDYSFHIWDFQVMY